MDINNARWTDARKETVEVTIDGQVWFVPASKENRMWNKMVEVKLVILDKGVK